MKTYITNPVKQSCKQMEYPAQPLSRTLVKHLLDTLNYIFHEALQSK